jgi:hypothetical protein
MVAGNETTMSNAIKLGMSKKTIVGLSLGQRVTCLIHKPRPGDAARGPVLVARAFGRVVAGVDVTGWGPDRIQRLARLCGNETGVVVEEDHA